MKNAQAPYVVSEDIQLLLRQWFQVGHNVKLPSPEFFRKLRSEFSLFMRQIFPAFEMVSEEELRRGLNDFVTKAGLPVVSLDRVYLKQEFHIDSSRGVDKENNELPGMGERRGDLGDGHTFIAHQLSLLEQSGLRDVALADDVIFEGELIEHVIVMLAKRGITVRKVFAGVGVGRGVSRIKNMGSIEVDCVRYYPEVMDQICERDFYPGVPCSGRTLTTYDFGRNRVASYTGVPYLYPFGRPVEWASIPPDRAADFSRFCLRQTVILWKAIERESTKDPRSRVQSMMPTLFPLRCCEVPRRVVGLTGQSLFITELERAIGRIAD